MPRGWGRGSSAVTVLLIDRPWPHRITMQPLLSPPAWPACASPPFWAPGTRHQIGVKILRVSFAAVDGADNRDRLAVESGSAEADSLLRLPPSVQQQVGSRPEPAPSRQGLEYSMMSVLPLPLSAALVQARHWQKAQGPGSEGVKGRQTPGGWGWRTNGKPQFIPLPHPA